MNESPSASRSLSNNPIATGLIGLLAGAVLAYGIGHWQRSEALAAQAETHAAEITAKNAELAAAAEKLAAADLANRAAAGRVALVQARLGLYQALSDLDQRNFGVAADRLREAAARFDAVDAQALGLDAALLTGLQSEIANTQVLVATDFEQQRLGLLELAARIEAQTAAALATAPAPDAP